MLYRNPADGSNFLQLLDPSTGLFAPAVPLDFTVWPDATSLAIGETSNGTDNFVAISFMNAANDYSFRIVNPADGTSSEALSGNTGAKIDMETWADFAGVGYGQMIYKPVGQRFQQFDFGPFNGSFDLFKVGPYTRFIGVSDMNQDGHPDFVMQNPATGKIRAQEFNGLSYLGLSTESYQHRTDVRQWVGATEEDLSFSGSITPFTFLFAKAPGLNTIVHVLDGFSEIFPGKLNDKGYDLLAVGRSFAPNPVISSRAKWKNSIQPYTGD